MDPWLFRRISIRYLLSEQATDVIGRVIHRSDTLVHLMRRDGHIEVVPISDIIAAREVPDDTRRLRPAAVFPQSQLSPMIKRISGEHVSMSSVWVADVYRLPVPDEQGDAATEQGAAQVVVQVLVQPDESFTRTAEAAGPDFAGLDFAGLDFAGPELVEPVRAYLRTDGGSIARVVLSGDWLTLDPVFITSGAQRREEILALWHKGIAWARARGAVYAWALPALDDLAMRQVLTELSFEPFDDPLNDPLNEPFGKPLAE